MLSSFNVFFLVFLAIVSWIMLCLINSGPIYHNSHFIKESDRSKDMLKLWMRRFFSTLFTRGPNLTVYLICTLLGVFILINVIARKVKTIAMVAARNEGYSNLLLQISRLKEENAALFNSMKQQKLEKKVFVQHININAALIEKLKAELCLMKERYERVKRKIILLSKENEKIGEESSNTSTSYIERSKERFTQSYYPNEKPISEYSDSSPVAFNSSDIINEILKETYEKGSYVLFSNGRQIRRNAKDYFICDDIASTHVLKELNNINIVSTDQLQKIKGIELSSILPNFT